MDNYTAMNNIWIKKLKLFEEEFKNLPISKVNKSAHTTVHFENKQIKTVYKLYYLFASDSRRRSDSDTDSNR